MSNEIMTPYTLIAQAIEKGTTIETMEKLFDLNERWEKKEAAKAFKKAMVDFQSKKPKLTKSSKVDYNIQGGGSVKYAYNSLPNIQAEVDPILSEVGLSYRWEQQPEGDKFKVVCIVSHIEGHEEQTFIIAPADTSGKKNAIQSIGSSISYLKRYTLEGALGLSSDKDDDGKATGEPKAESQPTTQATKGKQPLTPESPQWADAVKTLADNPTKLKAVKKHYELTEDHEKLLLEQSKKPVENANA